MGQTKERFEVLLSKYLDKSCSLDEVKELFSYMGVPEYQERLENVMEKYYKTLVPGTEVHDVDWEIMLNSIIGDQEKTRVRSLWSRIIPIAAAIIVVVAAGILIRGNQQELQQKVSIASTKKDIAPGGNKAILKLADGTEIVLDGHITGVLANEDGTKISKTADGMLLYDASKSVGDEINANAENHINTLSTPSGGQYTLILPDKTKVWLNAESSISYPSVFAGAERNVLLVGEAYFEVSKDKQHPFKVKTGAAEVRVLGTHFNIMSYFQEGQTQISLAEGSVRVDVGNDSKILSPGQQALIKAGSNHITLKNVDIDEVTNWKNGLFQFDNTPLEQVMRQIKRWYSVDVVYEGIRPDLYITGMISRSNNVSKILALIEETGGIEFEIGDKQIVVKKSKRR
jgi:transmembrane sensor